MKHYDSIPRIQDNGELKGEMVVGYNKLDGQNFCAVFNNRKKTWGPYGSRTVTVDINSEQFGDCVRFFEQSWYKTILENIINENSGKKGIFNGVEEITFFFEWYGDHSFAGRHQEGDDMNLALIDVFLKKKGYIEPKDYELCFRSSGIEMPMLIYSGVLDSNIVQKVQDNDWTNPYCWNPFVKEGVVFKRSTRMKGQRRPSVKIKTKWWLTKLRSMYDEEQCKLLE